MQLKLPATRIAVENARKQAPKITPAAVIRPIFQEFGIVDGCTLSVVSDIVRKSPVTIKRIISIGVKTACPVITRPTASRSTCNIFFMTEFSV